MKQNNIFSGKRFLRLLRQHILHSYSALLLGLVVGFGICFLVIAFLQFVGNPNQINDNEFLIIAIFGYVILGSFYISSAFSPFRNKERAQAYLMTPGTTLEKYLVEFIFYPLLYLLAFPVLYFIAYQLSTSFISMIKLDFIPFNLIDKFKELLITKEYSFEDGVITTKDVSILILWISAGFSLAMAFFLGASSFKKYVMLKTLLGLVVYFGACVWMFYYLIKVLKWGDYGISLGKSYLTPFGTGSGNPQAPIAFFSLWILCWGIIFSVVSFLKLREKEV